MIGVGAEGSAVVSALPSTPTLTGALVRLEPLSLEHAPGLCRAAAEDRSTYAYLRVPADPADMHDTIVQILADAAAGQCQPYAVRVLRTGLVVGTTRFIALEGGGLLDVSGATGPSVVEIGGTWYAASAQRTGANRDAKRLMLDQALLVWATLRVRFKTDVRNARSRAALEGIGAQFEGIQQAHKRAPDGTMRDSAWYAIEREQWPELRLRLLQSPTS
jgi:RimJ/RimL family protein N-acetyltransferase